MKRKKIREMRGRGENYHGREEIQKMSKEEVRTSKRRPGTKMRPREEEERGRNRRNRRKKRSVISWKK